jgi:hypothetical protein
LDQTKYIVETWDHKFVDSEIVRLLSRVYAFCEEGHVIMDYFFVPFHFRVGMELHNVVGTLMDQPHE